jgi:DNA modification methylase
MWPLKRLKPYERNARTHSPEQVAQIAASIQEFGFTNPILVDGDDGILAGHGRLAAAKDMGLAEVPVVVLDHLSEAQKRAYVLADNKLALNAGWDESLLRLELTDLGELDFDLSLIGFSEDELAELLPEIEELAPEDADEESVPEAPAEPVTKPGDVWLMGKHRLMCGDATAPADWDKLQIQRPAMVFSSPPYGVGANAKLRDKYKRGAAERKSLYATHDDNPDEWPDLMRGWTNNALAHTDCIVCNIQTLANNKRNLFAWSAEYMSHMVDVAIWDKGHGAPQMQRNVLTNSFEWLFILAPEENPSRALPLADFHGTEENIVRLGKGSREFADIHRATMPVELAEWAVVSAGPKAAVVVDPFGGTGTTLIAAEKHGKIACLIEIDPRYCDVIVKRWQQFTGKRARLEATGELFSCDA